MFKKFVLGLAIFAAGLFLSINGLGSDRGARILEETRSQVRILTAPGAENMGGTGFAVRAPSGKVYTLSNAHVCGLADGGIMAARNANGRYTQIKVLEVSKVTDLCILEAFPNASGVYMADKQGSMSDRLFVVGHPRLEPATLSEGFLQKFLSVEIQYDGIMCEGYPTVEGVCTRIITSYLVSNITYPGNSGSPIMNAAGNLVGVIYAGNGGTNHGAIVPLEDVKEFLKAY